MNFIRRLFGKTHNADQNDSGQPCAESPRVAEGTVNAVEPVLEKDASLDGPTLWYDHVDTLSAEDTVQRESIDAQTTPHYEGLRIGYASDVGQLREHNEDTLIAFQGIHLGDDASDPFGFFVVADGMGGHRAGEVASSLAARTMIQQVLKNIYLPFLLNETPGADMIPLTEILRDAVQKANDQVYEQVSGGGTTLTSALILGRRAYIAHVGDSRAYLLTNHDMRQVTQDHSFVNRLIELGGLSPEEAAVHPQRHVLYRAVGQGDNLDIDTYQQPLPPGSSLLLCSDGLSGQVPEQEIGRIVASAATPQEACQRLVEAANQGRWTRQYYGYAHQSSTGIERLSNCNDDGF